MPRLPGRRLDFLKAVREQEREESTHVPENEERTTQSASESENPAIPSPQPKDGRPRTNQDWWPNQVDLSILHRNSPLSNPMPENFNYVEELGNLDFEAL